MTLMSSITPEPKQHSLHWKQTNILRVKTCKQMISIRNCIYCEMQEIWQHVRISAYHVEMLKKICEKIRWKNINFSLDAHGSCIMANHLITWHCLWRFLAETNHVFEHLLPCSLDLVLCSLPKDIRNSERYIK